MFAVPGEIGSALSAGTNALLKLGAAPLTSRRRRARRVRPRSPRAEERDEPRSTSCRRRCDELVRRTGRPAPTSAATLIDLELAGRVGLP